MSDHPRSARRAVQRRTVLRAGAGGAAAVSTATALAPDASATPTPSALPAAPSASAAPTRGRQFRALWVASVENIDWPSKPGLSIAQQKAEFTALCRRARELNMNALICQVRPTADAFWPSPYEPWSQYLTGTVGKDPGYDPLRFQVAEAHRHNLEYHAWFNPYRVATHADPTTLAPGHPARKHPEWVHAYGGKLYYDPGLPEVRRFVEDAMLHAVAHADIDAVHFDDYFYPYPVEGEEFPDQATFAKHGRGMSLADWRRDNVNTMVREMHQRIRAIKPWVKFGISPFGVWRNRSSDPRGSDTKASEGYEIISCDPLAWMRDGAVDYLCPQIYWEIGHPLADYGVLAPWWDRAVADSGTALYIGQAAYKATEGKGAWADPRELAKHLERDHGLAHVDGDAYFSAKDAMTDPRGAFAALRQGAYKNPAVVPPIAAMPGRAPESPVGVRARRHGGEIEVRWTRPRSSRAVSYAVVEAPSARRSAEELLGDGSGILATLRADASHPAQSARVRSTDAPIAVIAFDRLWAASAPSRRAHVR